jgi:hypothetical protein
MDMFYYTRVTFQHIIIIIHEPKLLFMNFL